MGGGAGEGSFVRGGGQGKLMSAGHGQELYWVPPVFADRDAEYLYGIVLLANGRLLKRCFRKSCMHSMSTRAKLAKASGECTKHGSARLENKQLPLHLKARSSFVVEMLLIESLSRSTQLLAPGKSKANE
jgi:hypothetical protein